ncbi:uncharacterized protein TrAFT101_005698 [Trichoderma asperellum]|uniref:uncharacterized protein n=1 Tax=Trichoderma asperellum TaxID=101201 RepID=UPI003319ECE3|nr:hypothetical protein TrAFT101_005698 [Trichoderma asperellum]
MLLRLNTTQKTQPLPWHWSRYRLGAAGQRHQHPASWKQSPAVNLYLRRESITCIYHNATKQLKINHQRLALPLTHSGATESIHTSSPIRCYSSASRISGRRADSSRTATRFSPTASWTSTAARH